MTYGITGNPTKEQVWAPVARLIEWFQQHNIDFCLNEPIAKGLHERSLVSSSVCSEQSAVDLAHQSDMVLSFGGDGTLLRSAHTTGPNDTPLLGVNIGRLGFLADIEVEQITMALEAIERGEYSVEERLVLEATADDHGSFGTQWALNEFVLDRSGATGLMRIQVQVNGTPLNNYWADGIIIATPTGSTAYSLSTGGPILTPGVGAIIITPIASHTLTVRPIVLPADVTIQARVLSNRHSYVFATDGRSTLLEDEDHAFTIQKAPHTVNLVKLDGQHFFHTLRSKLMWGMHRRGASDSETGDSDTLSFSLSSPDANSQEDAGDAQSGELGVKASETD